MEKERLQQQNTDLSHLCAKLSIERDAAVTAHAELSGKTARLEKDLKQSDSAKLLAEGLVQDLQARINTSENRLKYIENAYKVGDSFV